MSLSIVQENLGKWHPQALSKPAGSELPALVDTAGEGEEEAEGMADSVRLGPFHLNTAVHAPPAVWGMFS